MRILFFAFALFLFSCKKLHSCEDCYLVEEPSPANAIIHWTGPVEADGCDWIIQIDSVFYHPNKLDNSCKQDQLPVVIKYSPSN